MPVTGFIHMKSMIWLPVLIAGLCGLAMARDENPEEFDRPPLKERIGLSHGAAVVRFYEPDEGEARAIMVFGSGDGGWSPWEHAVAQWLRDAGIHVVGLDFREYAAGDYDQNTLARDMAALAAAAASRINGGASLPVIYGGWSMGAAQAVAAAAGPERPPNLAGLMLMSTDHRGRYGLREGDELGITPVGPGTFALTHFSAAMRNLRVAQFHGTADFMASTAWVQTLKSPHALYLVPGANHGFNGPDDSFREYLERGVAWVLGDDSAAAAPPVRSLPFGLSPLWPGALLAIGLVVFFLLSRRHSIRLLVASVFVIGLINLFEAFLRKPPFMIDWLEGWLPLGLAEQSHLPLFLSGLCLLALARGLSRRKRAAWVLAVVMLVVSVFLHLLRSLDWHHMAAALILLVPLVRWRREFIARSDASSLHWAFRLALFIAAGLLVFGTVGIHMHAERGEFGEPLHWDECVRGSAMALLLQSTELDDDGGRAARDFLGNLRGGSLLGGLVALGLVLRPVLEKRLPHATGDERGKARRLIDQYGVDPMDAFALMDDKRYFFHPDGSAVVAYSLWRNFAVALADPIGDPAQQAGTIAAFAKFCRRQDWEPVFYCVNVRNRPLYEELGFVTLKVGEDARIPMAAFSLQGGKFQNLRTAANRARREKMGFRWYDASQGIDHGIEAQLRLLSDEWLQAKYGGEMTFDLGRFDLDHIRTHGAAVILNAGGRVEAFATWHPYAQGRGRTLDLMRGGAEARNGGLMDYLILESIGRFQEAGVEEISLGNAPLADVRQEGDGEPAGREKATRFLFENFDKYYGYKSLFSFKKKYHPDWQGRYLAYPAGAPLLMVGLAVAGVHLPSGFRALLKS